MDGPAPRRRQNGRVVGRLGIAPGASCWAVGWAGAQHDADDNRGIRWGIAESYRLECDGGADTRGAGYGPERCRLSRGSIRTKRPRMHGIQSGPSSSHTFRNYALPIPSCADVGGPMCPFHQKERSHVMSAHILPLPWLVYRIRELDFASRIGIDPRPSAEATTYFLSRRFGSSGGLSLSTSSGDLLHTTSKRGRIWARWPASGL